MVNKNYSERYGTYEWFENKFKLSSGDPWGHNWRGVEQYRHERVIKFIVKYILKENNTYDGLNILDIGCATGDFTKRLYELNKNVIGIDISKIAIERAKTKYNYIDFRNCSLPELHIQGRSFDLITCLEVIYYLDEHLKKNFLIEIKKLLNRGGKALVTSKIGEKPYFEPEELISLLSDNSFKVKAIAYYGNSFFSGVEKKLFDKYMQINRFHKLLFLSYQKLEEELSLNENKMIKEIINYLVRYEVIKLITCSFLQLLKGMIKILLVWKFPAKVFNFIANKLFLKHTHTFILITKE